MATWRLLALLWVMSSSSDTAQTGPSAGFEATPQWIQKTYERAMSISRTENLLRVLPRAKHAWKPVQREAIDKVRASVGSFPQDAQRRVADGYSPFINDTLADLVRACNLAAKNGHGDLVFLSAEYNCGKRTMYPSNGTQAVAVTTRFAACLHLLLSDMDPARIDMLLMQIADENSLWPPRGSSAVYEPFGNSTKHESGCSVGGQDKHWEGFERPGMWDARYIAKSIRGVERWVIKPRRKGQAELLAWCKFPEYNEAAKWRTFVHEEGERPSFGACVGEGGDIDLAYTPTMQAQKRKLRSMMVEASLRFYTTDADEAAIGAGQTHIHFFPKEHTQSHFFPRIHTHTWTQSLSAHTHKHFLPMLHTRRYVCKMCCPE
jgi:hypothetical protein